MRFRALLLIAVTTASVLAVPYAGAAPSGRLELSGSRASQTEIVLRRSSEILASDFRMKTKGTYAGIAVQDNKGQVVAFLMNVQTWIDSRPSVAGVPMASMNEFSRATLKPGRYRLLLLADAPATVSVRVTGDLGRKVKATRSYDDNVTLADVRGPVGAAVHTGTVPADLRKSKYAVVAQYIETDGQQGQVTDVCFAPTDSAFCTPTQNIGGTHARTSAGAPPGALGWVRGTFYLNTVGSGLETAPTAHEVRFSDASASLPAARYGLVVII